MYPRRIRLGELLIQAGLLSQEQLDKALVEQKKSGLKLGQYLIHAGVCREVDVIEALSRQLRIRRYTPSEFPVNPDLSQLVPVELARKHRVAPLAMVGTMLVLAMVDPLDIEAMDTVQFTADCEVEPMVCTEQEFNQLFQTIYSGHSDLDGILESLESMRVETDDEREKDATEIHVGSLADQAGEAPVIRLVNSIIGQAVREKASDVHLSPEKDRVTIRFRIDGKLHEMPAPPKRMFLPLVSRIKLLSQMDISVTRVPQDGRFTVTLDRREVNVRASCLPTIYGENVVLRLLDMSAGGLTLEQLGMSPWDLNIIRGSSEKPYGLILSTGPTGSGKSTSLYSILRNINRPDINIITLEDPVEYRLMGIRQTQLNRRAGMTFASGLRSILRQDPDVIMIGEIRDAETAGIAVQAAMTGHRVLSTVHTNDAAGAVTRLVDMGIEPFLVSTTLLVSFAQRLMRRVCSNCAEPYTPDPNAMRQFGLNPDTPGDYRKGKGCHHCMNTGYKGRVGIFESLKVTDEVADMIVRRCSSGEINKAMLQKRQLRLLRHDAADKVRKGLTTLEEAMSAVMH